MVRHDLRTQEELATRFSNAANYSVIVAVLVASSAVGFYFAWRGYKNADEYVTGGRTMTTLPVTLSLLTSFMSAITLLGTPVEIYMKGTQFSAVFISYIAQAWIVATFFLPVFTRLRLISSFEYLELRFHSKLLRTICCICYAIQTILYMAVAVYAPSLTLAQVTGVEVHYSNAIIFGVCMVYTCLGGLKAVMWTEVLQFVVMVISYAVLVWEGISQTGSAEVLKRNVEADRLQFFNLDADLRERHTLWGLSIGSCFVGLALHGVSQTQVQRYVACKNEKVARRALYWTAPGLTLMLFLCVILGMIIFAYYFDCDPVSMKQVEKSDQLVPLFVMQVMGDYPGVPGLLVAGLLSATLSSVSSGLNALAAVFLQDGLRSFSIFKFNGGASSEKGGNASNKMQLCVTRLLAFAFGALSYAFTFAMEFLPGVLEACNGLLGILGGPVLGVFTLGMFFPFANAKGALSGVLSSLIMSLWMGFGQQVYSKTFGCSRTHRPPPLSFDTSQCPSAWGEPPAPKNATSCPAVTDFTHLALYDVSYIWYAAIATMWVIVVGVCVSLVTTPQDSTTLRSELISPNATLLFRWWPSVMRDPLDKYFAGVGSQTDSAAKGIMDNEVTLELDEMESKKDGPPDGTQREGDAYTGGGGYIEDAAASRTNVVGEAENMEVLVHFREQVSVQ
eukprot:GEMP01018073.1.p1 GENE.GEMP01018073.1~~GEMP01018073.1.p1  ORF type:complete len:675 (+),score=129.95 GEMP01018073.1:174-2198(+)